jgi:ADP-heptose:LPS heptosyltransferase
MLLQKLDKSKINKILVISLSNIGDVILTFPAVDVLLNDFPKAKISLVVGPKAESLFYGSRIIEKIFFYHKQSSLMSKLKWLNLLRKEKFDLVVDLRNTAIPIFLYPKYRTSLIDSKRDGQHMMVKHLNRLNSVYNFEHKFYERKILFIPLADKQKVETLLSNEIQGKKYVLLAPGAANHQKRWSVEGYAQVADYLVEKYDIAAVFVGDKNDGETITSIMQIMKNKPLNLAGQITLLQLVELLKKAIMLITNDSAPMHLASYLETNVLALYGPSDPIKYGPWSKNSHFLKSQGEDIAAIKSSEVINSFKIENNQAVFIH